VQIGAIAPVSNAAQYRRQYKLAELPLSGEPEHNPSLSELQEGSDINCSNIRKEVKKY
jgi:hypothetical protein